MSETRQRPPAAHDTGEEGPSAGTQARNDGAPVETPDRPRETQDRSRAPQPPTLPRSSAATTGEIEAIQELPLLTRLNERGFRLVMIADALALFAILVASMVYRFGFEWPIGSATDPYEVWEYFASFGLVAALHMLMFYFGGLYEREPRLGYPPVLPRVARLSFGAILVFMGLTFVLSGTGVRFLPAPTANLAGLFVVGTLAVSGNRWLTRRVRLRNQGPPRILLVGAPDEVNVAMSHLKEEQRAVVVGEASDAADIVERVTDMRVTDVILLSSRWLDDIYPGVLREFEARDVGILQRVAAKETLFGLENVRQVGGLPFVPLKEHTLPLSRVRFKRFLEMLFLVVTAPLYLPVVGALCLYQLAVVGRPIFFWQTRVGRDGSTFEMVKFRTMVPEAEEDGDPKLATRDDPRIISACRWLRATRLDEVPQLWNVWRGEMSLVGPRPERPELTAQYEQLIPGYATRYEIPPGITGLAQVHGRYHTDPEYKLGYDLQYLVNWSPLLDLEILARTIWVVLTRRI